MLFRSLFSENGEGKYLLENQYLVNKTKSISLGPLTEEEFKKSIIISDPKNISVFVNTIETKFVSTAPLTEDIKISVQKKIENIENIPLDESKLEEFILSPNLFEDISKIIIFRSEDEIKIVSEKYNKIESILKNFKDINNFFWDI